MFDERETADSAHTTEGSPRYGAISRDTGISLVAGGSLMLATILGMLIVADTALAQFGNALWKFPLLGLLVFGVLLSAGRRYGLRGLGEANYKMALGGCLLSVFTYAWFGGLVLSPYAASLYRPAIVITGAITLVITMLATGLVFSTDRSFEGWEAYAGGFFLIGVALMLFAMFVPQLLVVAFPFFLIGWILDLVYEVWMVSNQNRSPLANGLALYIAFAGIFVHAIQLVLRLLERMDEKYPF